MKILVLAIFVAETFGFSIPFSSAQHNIYNENFLPIENEVKRNFFGKYLNAMDDENDFYKQFLNNLSFK
ncbi:Oidioi.mRNA.OKI2018_I69.chr1.g544.t1.cds [Oikopleura dioica]|uniref:Oidioi.mRNA.OKI2018_I69.chr1.g544.t1.cds n=1 Tax=Oikopleura dioica TaxID=34765 RepID=A0ABN7SK70_OIKDI|nr:Oidioi.mRNA.OKI2018_I69.chr1.g544.t1.cds [Oikopleura dioica]